MLYVISILNYVDICFLDFSIVLWLVIYFLSLIECVCRFSLFIVYGLCDEVMSHQSYYARFYMGRYVCLLLVWVVLNVACTATYSYLW